MGSFKQLIKPVVPAPLLQWVRCRRAGRPYAPPVGWLRFGSLRRLEPVSRLWGYDRGLPVDRYYIERFLARHAADVRGRVLDVGENAYTRRFGGDRVTQSDVLHVTPGAPGATIIADLTDAPGVPSDAFDCVILVQTLQLIYDVRAAVATVHRILRPGGVLLATAPGITHVNRHDGDSWGDSWCWNYTALSLRRLFAERFDPADVEVRSHGNVLAATAFLQGLAVEDLSRRELDHHDPDYEVTLTVRAVKRGAPGSGAAGNGAGGAA